ncbi:uncharacterized protein [Drosophila bipectinata]|uniref:uncharacterized protein n=1 Tax=Drosophila bipectinata TaxID=42026 RepID=UPI0038B34332
MSVDELQRKYTQWNSVHQTLLDPEATKRFRLFLETKISGDKDAAIQYLDLYEKSSKFLQETQHTFAQDKVDKLVDLGLPYDLEQDLKRRALSGQRNDINLGLYRVLDKCRNEIEASSEFRDFRNALVGVKKRNLLWRSC